MQLPYVRMLAFSALIGLYLVSPALGVIGLTAGFTFALLRARAQEAESTITTLDLG